MTDELTILHGADPVPATHPLFGDQPLDERAFAELHELLGGEPAARRGRWAAAAAGVAGVALAAAAAGALWPWGDGASPAYAATPPLLPLTQPVQADASTQLHELAVHAGASAEQPTNERTSSWESWSVWTRIGGRQATSAVVPEEGRLQWRPDGSGTVDVVTGVPWFPSQEYRDAWDDAGQPVDAGTVVRRDRFSPGDYQAMYPQEPPADATAMRAYLAQGHALDESGSAELLVAVADLHREWRLGPAQRAAVLEVLSRAPALEALGATTDRLGREGETFAAESDANGLPTRYVLVVDRRDGQVLAAEQWLTTDAGRLDVRVPSVVSYTSWKE